MLPEPTVSALVPVYAGTSASLLHRALTSLADQTRPADEVVVVADGPLTPEHDEVLSSFPAVRRIDVAVHQGLGIALARGLEACTGDYVVRADADDINEPSRIRIQLDALLQQNADVCSAAMTEEVGDPPISIGIRRSLIDHAEFARVMRTRNPVNHPTAVFRREAALQVGGYQHLPNLEDYDLWARLLASGAVFTGVTDSLVRFRADGVHERRTDRAIDASEAELQRRLVSYGVISRPRRWCNLVVRGTYRRLPRPLLEWVYGRLWRH